MADHRQSIKQWSTQDKPREKLMDKGVGTLSDSELLAILISSGTKDLSALDVARNLLNLADNSLHNLSGMSLKDLQKIKGIGSAKGVTILAAIELGMRRLHAIRPHKQPITKSAESAFLFEIIRHSKQEEFWLACFNRAMIPVYVGRVHLGGISAVSADQRIIYKTALEHHASSIIVAHNHPSGTLKPSKADLEVTKMLKSAGDLLEIKLTDHLILTEDAYFSFADEGLI